MLIHRRDGERAPSRKEEGPLVLGSRVGGTERKNDPPSGAPISDIIFQCRYHEAHVGFLTQEILIK